MTVLPIDTCSIANMLRNKSIAKTLSRAVAPEQAGREGVAFGKNYPKIMGQLESFPKNQKNLTFTMKVYMKFPAIPDGEALFMFRSIRIEQDSNGSFYMQYHPYINNTFLVDRLLLDIPSIDFTKDLDDDDWVELVGIKMKVQNRRKRETSSQWMVLGFDLYVHPGKIGHFKVYGNGKLIHHQELKGDDRVWLVRSHSPTMHDVKMSCIEFGTDVQDASYFEDINLNECSKFPYWPLALFDLIC